VIEPLALNADLHCHSDVSDGTLSPESVAARAHANGVQLWSLTDHDETGGQQRARRAALELGMPFLSGVEVSVTFAGKTVHIVGLGFELGDATLRQGLAATRGGRGQRAREMAQALAAVGVEGAYEGALKYVGNPELISRTHFARYLVEAGVCASTPEVFRHYLADGKPGYVPHRWAQLADAVGWIRGAGRTAAKHGRVRHCRRQHRLGRAVRHPSADGATDCRAAGPAALTHQ
jgi:predicted metal-dependent phosphoesterase TrpH